MYVSGAAMQASPVPSLPLAKATPDASTIAASAAGGFSGVLAESMAGTSPAGRVAHRGGKEATGDLSSELRPDARSQGELAATAIADATASLLAAIQLPPSLQPPAPPQIMLKPSKTTDLTVDQAVVPLQDAGGSVEPKKVNNSVRLVAPVGSEPILAKLIAKAGSTSAPAIGASEVADHISAMTTDVKLAAAATSAEPSLPAEPLQAQDVHGQSVEADSSATRGGVTPPVIVQPSTHATVMSNQFTCRGIESPVTASVRREVRPVPETESIEASGQRSPGSAAKPDSEIAGLEELPQFVGTTTRLFQRPETSPMVSRPAESAKGTAVAAAAQPKEEQRTPAPGIAPANKILFNKVLSIQTGVPEPVPGPPQLEPKSATPPDRTETPSLAAVRIKEAITPENHSGTPAAKAAMTEILPATAGSGIGEKVERTPTSTAPIGDPRESSERKPAFVAGQASMPAREVPAVVATVKESAPVLTVENPVPSIPQNHIATPGPRELPQTHQILDSAPAPTNTAEGTQARADATGDAQMRVGIRTAAFGAVEIYTAVHQNQVGVAIHGTRELTQLFTTEVQNVESGLRDHHLNLTTVELHSSGSGLETSTGSHQQRPPHHSHTGTHVWGGAVTETVMETASMELAASNQIGRLEDGRVSIRV